MGDSHLAWATLMGTLGLRLGGKNVCQITMAGDYKVHGEAE